MARPIANGQRLGRGIDPLREGRCFYLLVLLKKRIGIQNRMAVRQSFFVCLGFLLTTCFGLASSLADTSPPNILFILVDDLGWRDVGCYGSTFYETPKIDALAKSGVSFSNGYASCPVCSPTRASVFSGKYPARLGLTAHIGAPQPNQYKGNTPLKPAKYVDHLPLDEVTVAEAFHDQGYATFFAGKWHLGSKDRYWPEYQGFDINQGGWAQGGPFGGKQYFPPYNNPRLKDGPPGEHLTDRLATETVRFIETHKHKPFFACLSFYSVHVPLVAREDLRQKYERKRNPFGETDTPIYEFDGETRVRQVQEHAVYAAMVEAMDEAVGKVLDSLEEQGLADNTIVIFTSDNGGLSTGDRGISRDQGWPTSNTPLRAGKGWLYEGGIRVPVIVRAPGITDPGSQTDAVVTSTDYYPTMLELAGLSTLPNQHQDGVSLVPALNGGELERDTVYWHYPHYGNQGGRPGGVIRHGDWKLIQWYGESEVELYNLAEDIGEQQNLSEHESELRDSLLAKLSAWRDSMGALMPEPNTKHIADASAVKNQ